MERLKEFWIVGLWGERNYHLIIDDGKLIMVGENGCGKSTVLRIMFYTLSRKWGKLLKEDFVKIKVVFEDSEMEFTKEQIGRDNDYYLDSSSELFTKLPIMFRRRYMDGRMDRIMLDDVREILYSMGYSKSVLKEELDELERTIEVIPSSIRPVSDWLKMKSKQPVLFMPTYRRIEKQPEIPEREFGQTRLGKQYFENLMMEVSHIGMHDVEEAIQNLIASIKSEYANSSSQLNLECFKGILEQDFKEVASIPNEYMEPESIEMVFESLNKNELWDVDKIQIKEKLIAIIGKTEEYEEFDKIVIYYYNMLIKRYESLKEIENQLEHFFYVCNQYLSGKEFVYRPNSFEYVIEVRSHNGSKKEINIEQLSSGEKQIVALFSYIYLFVKKSCTIIIDEPELSLSVLWQQTILEDIVKSNKCNHLIVATQSPFVYDNSLMQYGHAMEEFLTLE